MLAKEIIVETIPPIKPSESGEKALLWMDEFKVVHLPVVRGREYLGLVSDDMIYDQNTPSIPLSDMNMVFNKAFVYEDSHFFEVMKSIAEHNLTIVPILDKEGNYLGCTTLKKVVDYFVNTAGITGDGAVVVLEMNRIDYSLAKIAQIVEANRSMIMSSFVSSQYDSKKIEVTLKLNNNNIAGVLQAFNRYDYVVKSYFTSDNIANSIKNNYEALINYLNI